MVYDSSAKVYDLPAICFAIKSGLERTCTIDLLPHDDLPEPFQTLHGSAVRVEGKEAEAATACNHDLAPSRGGCERSLFINVNLWWGLVMLLFGCLMFLFAWRKIQAARG